MEQKQPTRIALLAVAAIFIVTVQGARAADECIEKPNARSPQGSHWYYRTDRTNNRQCWYLSSERGNAGTLPRQDTAPARPQSSKMSAPPAQTPAQATAAVETATAEVITAEAAPVEITGQDNTPENNSTVTLSRFQAGIPTPPNSSSVSVSAAAPQEMGLTGPIVTPTKRSGAVPGRASSFLTQFCALLAAVLGLAAIIGTFTLSAGRKPMPKSQSARGQLSFTRTAVGTDEHVLERFARTAASTDANVPEPFARTAAGTDEHVLEPFARMAASTDANVLERFARTAAGTDANVPEPFARTAVGTDEHMLEPFASMAAGSDEHVLEPFARTAANTDEAGMAADWASSPPTDTVAGIESTLQHLLRGLEQLRHEDARRGFEPPRKAVA